MTWWEGHKYPEFARDHQDIPQLIWQGVNVHKKPIDLFYYHEEIYRRQPDWIIETGTLSGGSALFFTCCHPGVRVVTIDNYRRTRPVHPRICYIEGSSTDARTLSRVQLLTWGKIMVTLDSDHTYPHVSKEIALYAPLVTQGQLLVVEDTLVVKDANRAAEALTEPDSGFTEIEPNLMITFHRWFEAT